jgi:hypothetical protein
VRKGKNYNREGEQIPGATLSVELANGARDKPFAKHLPMLLRAIAVQLGRNIRRNTTP